MTYKKCLFQTLTVAKGREKKHNRKIGTPIRIRNRNRIHSGLGSGSTFSKGGSEDPDPDPLFPKGGSEDPDPDPLYPNEDPRIRIRIHVKIRWIRNPDLDDEIYVIPTIYRTGPSH